jgi:methylmalonyl-CoA mutase C-terminal domain/subunit
VDERIRVVISGPGPADAGRGAEILARTLRDAGVEVVYTDRPQEPAQLVATVVQEDADAVGIVLAGDDEAPARRVRELLADRGIDDVLVFAGADVGAPAEAADWLRARLRG